MLSHIIDHVITTQIGIKIVLHFLSHSLALILSSSDLYLTLSLLWFACKSISMHGLSSKLNLYF